LIRSVRKMRKEAIVILRFSMETDIGSWTPYYEEFVRGTKILRILS